MAALKQHADRVGGAMFWRRFWSFWKKFGVLGSVAAAIVAGFALWDDVLCQRFPEVAGLVPYAKCPPPKHVPQPSPTASAPVVERSPPPPPPSDSLGKLAHGVPVPSAQVYGELRNQLLIASKDGDESFVKGLVARGFTVRLDDACTLANELVQGRGAEKVASATMIDLFADVIKRGASCKAFGQDGSIPLDQFLLDEALRDVRQDCSDRPNPHWATRVTLLKGLLEKHPGTDGFVSLARKYSQLYEKAANQSRNQVVSLCELSGAGRIANDDRSLLYATGHCSPDNSQNFIHSRVSNVAMKRVMRHPGTEQEWDAIFIREHCQKAVARGGIRDAQIRSDLKQWAK
jgi:hypothetical protein